MKQLVFLLLAVNCFGFVNPDFTVNYRFTNRTGEPTDAVTVYNGATATVPISNYSLGCVGWEVDYNSEGFSAVSLNLQTNTKVWTGGLNFGPGNAWSTFSGTNSSGTLPMTSTSQGTYIGYSYFPFVRVNLATATGTGSIDVVLKCWKSINYASTGGIPGATIANVVFPCDSASASATVYTCTTGSLITLTSGTLVTWRPDVTCGINPTLNVDGTGAKSIYYFAPLNVFTNANASVCTNIGGGAPIQSYLLEYETSVAPGWVITGVTTAISPSSCITSGALIFQFGTVLDTYQCSTANLIGAGGRLNETLFGSATNCTSSAAPAVCAAAPAGSVVIAAAGTTVTVNTTAVTASSQIFLMYDSSLGTKLSVTCNTSEPALYGVTGRSTGVSFTITATAPVTNPACFSYFILN